jgi:single-stranded DNA-binding protein
MEITGRLTSDAVIADVTNTDRKVVNFTVAINDRYRAK